MSSLMSFKMESNLAELNPLASGSVMAWVASAPYTGSTNLKYHAQMNNYV